MKNEFILIYRISDKSRNSTINITNKINLLKKLICKLKFNQIHIIADNCRNESVNELKKIPSFLHITYLGNRNSFLYAISLVKKFRDDSIIYFCEDDYFHSNAISKYNYSTLNLMLQFFSYITFYDHPDKYSSFKGKCSNHVINGGSEKTFIKKFPIIDDLWRTTSSTTLTFLSKAATIKDDYLIWKIFTYGSNLPRDQLPWEIITQSFVPIQFKLNTIVKYLIILTFKFFKKKKYLGVPIITISEHLDQNILDLEYIKNRLNDVL